MVQNKSVIFKKIPEGVPKPGTDLTVEDRGFDLDALPKGGIVVKNLYNSFDPYLRGRMRPAHVKSYLPAFELDQPITSHAIFRVLKSDSPDWKEGDLGMANVPMAEYNAIGAERLAAPKGIYGVNRVDNKHNIDPSHFIGAVGMPGLTAYTSFYDIGQPKKGDTILVTAASGAVGQLVGHLAKHEGLKVVGSVGSDDKLEYIKKLGFEGFNYKKERPLAALKRLAPDGINIYYENVGGEHLEAALESINDFGRIVVCGMISQYNLGSDQKYGIRNLEHIFGKQLSMRGFLVASYEPKWFDELRERVSKWIADGEMNPEQTFTKGIDNAPQAFVDMLQGKNFGKATLVIGEEAN